MTSARAFGAALALLGALLPQPTWAEDLTLDDCVNLALRQATAVLNERIQTDLRGTEVLQSYGQFLPSIDAAGSFGYQTGKTLSIVQGLNLIDLTTRQASWSVSATLNIFNGLSDLSGLKSSLNRQSAENHSLEWAKTQVALDVTQTFLQMVLDQLLLEIARSTLKASQSRLRLIEGQAAVGSASKPDLFRQQAQTSEDLFSVTSFETRARNDEQLLVRKLRIDASAPHKFIKPPLDTPGSQLAAQPVDRLLADALASRPDLQAAEDRVDMSSWDVTRAASGFWPKVDLALSRAAAGAYVLHDSVNGSDVLTFAQNPLLNQLADQVQYAATLNLTWNLFGRFTTTLDVQRARAARETNEVARDDSKLQLQYDVRTAHANYGAAATQLDAAKVGLIAAEKSYQVTENMYEVGSASIVDVLTAQAALTQARSNEAQARTNLKLQERSLTYAIGRI